MDLHTTNRAKLDALATDIDFYLAGHEPGEVTDADAERFAQRRREIGQAALTRWLSLHGDGVGADQAGLSSTTEPGVTR